MLSGKFPSRKEQIGTLIVLRSFAKGLTFSGFVGNPFKSKRAKGLKVHQSTVENTYEKCLTSARKEPFYIFPWKNNQHSLGAPQKPFKH